MLRDRCHAYCHLGATGGCRTDGQVAAKLGRPFSHAAQPKATALLDLGRQPVAIVGYGQLDIGPAPVDADRHMARCRMFERIVERFDCDPVKGLGNRRCDGQPRVDCQGSVDAGALFDRVQAQLQCSRSGMASGVARRSS